MRVFKIPAIELHKLLTEIELALLSVNHCVTTDRVDAQPDENSWRIDETDLILKIQNLHKGIYPLSAHDKRSLLKKRLRRKKKHV